MRRIMPVLIGILLLALLARTIQTQASSPTAFGEWLATDPTNEHDYVAGDHMCLQFSDNTIKNATAAGYDNIYLARISGQTYPLDKNNTRDDIGTYMVAVADGAGNYVIYDPQTDRKMWVPWFDGHKVHIFSDYMLVPGDPGRIRCYGKDIMVDTVIQNTTQGDSYMFSPNARVIS